MGQEAITRSVIAGAALAGLLTLTACAGGPVSSPTPTPTPSAATASASPTPEAVDPQPGFPGSCDDLVDTAEIRAAFGADLPRREYEIFNANDGIPARAGGLVSCRWSENPGFPAGSELRVSVLPYDDEASVADWAASSYQDCYHSEIGGGSTTCNRDIWANDYWISVTFAAVPGAAATESVVAVDRLVASIGARVSAAPSVGEPSETPTTALTTSLCGRADMFATLAGVDVSSVTLYPQPFDEGGIVQTAIARAGTTACRWQIADGSGWSFSIVPGAAWAAGDAFFATEFDGEGGTRALTPVDITGSTSAFLSCADGEGGVSCGGNLIIDNSYVQVSTGGADPTIESTVADLERLLALI